MNTQEKCTLCLLNVRYLLIRKYKCLFIDMLMFVEADLYSQKEKFNKPTKQSISAALQVLFVFFFILEFIPVCVRGRCA